MTRTKTIKNLFLGILLASVAIFPAIAQSSFPLTDPFLGVHISTNTNTLAKTGVGVLHTFCINTKGASANIATVYDGTDNTGTVIAIIDTVNTAGCLQYDRAFKVGLFIVTATGTSADIHVSFR